MTSFPAIINIFDVSCSFNYRTDNLQKISRELRTRIFLKNFFYKFYKCEIEQFLVAETSDKQRHNKRDRN